MNKKTNTNPFYGKKELLELLLNASTVTEGTLTRIRSACKEEADVKLFHVICIAQGDVVNRHHNAFGGKKVDQGGNSNNTFWMVYQRWLLKNDTPQWCKFMRAGIFDEYVGFRELLSYEIRTQKKSKKITGTWGLLKDISDNADAYEALLDRVVECANGNPIKKVLVAKHVSKPTYGKRGAKKDRDMQDITLVKMKVYEKFLKDFCDRMNLEYYKSEDGRTVFSGFTNWRKPMLENSEHYVFSSGKIKDMGTEDFLAFLKQCPSTARERVRRRLFDVDGNEIPKYKKFANAYNIFIGYKEEKQAEVRKLEEKARTSTLSLGDQMKLQEAKKEAKVNTGATTLVSTITKLLSAPNTTDKVLVDSIVDKVNFDVPVLLAIDESGSMGSNWSGSNIGGNSVSPIAVAKLLLALTMYKNPDPTQALDMFIGFSTESRARLVTNGQPFQSKHASNRFVQGTVKTESTLVDRKLSFYENYKNVCRVVDTPGGGTDPSTILNPIESWVNSASGAEKESRKEILNKYPVLMIISDGEFNSSRNQAESLRQLQLRAARLGWHPVVVVWDIDGSEKPRHNKFESLDNVIHITGLELSTINTVFTRLTDIEVIDVYTPLQSLYSSNRYEKVKTEAWLQ